MRMKTWVSIVSITLMGIGAFARIHEHWSYERLRKEADLIVIATPISVRDTAERTTFPDVVRVDANDTNAFARSLMPPNLIPAIGVEATFEVLSVLKGVASGKTFVFHHLREAEKSNRVTYGGLGLVTFEAKEKKRFLLFLKRESDGRYAPLTGFTDAVLGVKDLGAYP